MSNCRNPDDLCSTLSSLPPSRSRTFRDVGFSLAASMCLKCTYASFREKSRKESPVFPSKQKLHETCVPHLPDHSRFYRSCMPPIASSPLVPYSALNHKLQISLGTAGPQPRAPDLSHHCRAPTDLSAVGTATPLSNFWGAGLSRSFRGAFADFRVTSIENCE